MEASSIALALLIAILPALFWLTIYYKKDAKDPEPKKTILKTFIAGALVALPFLGLRYLLEYMGASSLLIQGISGVVAFALMEEMAKLAASIFVVMRRPKVFNQVIDGVMYAVTAALGFAFVENAIYFSEMLTGASGSELMYSIAFRSVGTMLAHTLFSAMAGLIWAYAYFSKKISPFQQKHLLAFEARDFINKEILSLHILRNNILKARPSRRGGHEKKVLVLEGIIFATFLHVIYNLTTTFQVFGHSLTFLLVPAIIGAFLYISFLFTKRLNTKIFQVV